MVNNNQILEEIKRTFIEEKNAIERAFLKISDTYIEAVNAISIANKVILTGVGKSGIIAKKIAATLSSIGISSVFLHPVEALHGDIGIVQQGDVAILLSKSGSTDEIVKLVPYLKMQAATIISIVGNPNSFLARQADVFLDASVEKEACPYNLAPTSSSTLALVIGDALAIAAMKKRNVTLDSFSRLHPLGQIGRNITIQIKDIMHKDLNLPKVKLGVPLNEAIIEISKKGLGCVCIVENKDQLVGLITDGDLRRTLEKNIDTRDIIVDDIMTKTPITITEDAFLGEALSIMEQRLSQISVVPVLTRNNQLTGVVRIHDILRSGI